MASLSDQSGELCCKDMGAKKLRKWSRGHQFVVRGGGHIYVWQPLYIPEVILAYDNMCSLARLNAAKAPLPFPAPLDQMWLKIIKIIDTFHLKNHISESCRCQFSPERVKQQYPDMNTQVGEQTFTWLYHILCSMPKVHHLFYLHRMVVR